MKHIEQDLKAIQKGALYFAGYKKSISVDDLLDTLMDIYLIERDGAKFAVSLLVSAGKLKFDADHKLTSYRTPVCRQ